MILIVYRGVIEKLCAFFSGRYYLIVEVAPLEETVDYLNEFSVDLASGTDPRQPLMRPAANRQEKLIRISAEKARLRSGLARKPANNSWVYPCAYFTASYYLSWWLLFGDGAANDTFREVFFNLYGTAEDQAKTHAIAERTTGPRAGSPFFNGYWYSKRMDYWFKPGKRNLIAISELDHCLTLMGASAATLDPRGWTSPRPAHLKERELYQYLEIPEKYRDDEEGIMFWIISHSSTNNKQRKDVESDKIASRIIRALEFNALQKMQTDGGLLSLRD